MKGTPPSPPAARRLLASHPRPTRPKRRDSRVNYGGNHEREKEAWRCYGERRRSATERHQQARQVHPLSVSLVCTAAPAVHTPLCAAEVSGLTGGNLDVRSRQHMGVLGALSMAAKLACLSKLSRSIRYLFSLYQ
jgi:hypothetical protein